MTSERDPIFDAIELTLGRSLEPEREGSIQSLNDIPPSLVEEARRLPDLLAIAFIGHYIDLRPFRYVDPFHEDVICGGEDPSRWMR